MRIGSINRSLGVELAFGLFLAVLAAQPEPVFAQNPVAAPAAGGATPAPVSPGVNAKPAPTTPGETGSKGVPDDSSAVTLELTSRPVAFTSATAEWADGFKSVVGEIAKVDAAIKKAGLTPAGHPFAVFLATDDKSFQFQAMVPLAGKPEATDLADGVKIGESPSGKAMKFLHRGAYDDIDSTYDLITAFLDEKGLESQNRFVEEYLTDTTEPDDASLEADIYVFLK
ncbi:MAG: AraC family transcriptional regulator [Beijerinckiaceae bacterium]|nr:MAG: AraC family transcriptional regulator [Beijerinckiaceae bacterium]